MEQQLTPGKPVDLCCAEVYSSKEDSSKLTLHNRTIRNAHVSHYGATVDYEFLKGKKKWCKAAASIAYHLEKPSISVGFAAGGRLTLSAQVHYLKENEDKVLASFYAAIDVAMKDFCDRVSSEIALMRFAANSLHVAETIPA